MSSLTNRAASPRWKLTLRRREDEYANMPRERRIGIFRRMMVFLQKAEFKYRCFRMSKKYNSRQDAIHDVLLQDLLDFLISHREDFNPTFHVRLDGELFSRRNAA